MNEYNRNGDRVENLDDEARIFLLEERNRGTPVWTG